MRFIFQIVWLCYALPFGCLAQDGATPQAQTGLTDKITSFPTAFFKNVSDQTTTLDAALTRQTAKYLSKLAKQEARLRKKLSRQDSAAAKQLSSIPPLDYNALIQKIQNTTRPLTHLPGGRITGNYLPSLDSLKTSLKFLQQNQTLLSGSGGYQAQISSSLASVGQLQGKMQVADQVQQLIRQRKEQFRQALSQYTHLPGGLQNSYQAYSQQAYYYGAQLKAYKDELGDPDKLTKKALGFLGQLPAFQQFMKTHSDLAALFSIPGSGGSGGAKALAGLQTRSGVQQIIGAQVAAGGPDASQVVSQKIQSAQAQLKNLKNRIGQAGGGNSSMDLPDFRPNTQHVRTFLGRLTYGFNIQSVRADYYFPTTTDLGLSLGYKLNDRNTIGIGASYKIGWGPDIRHIAVSSQGVGLRSFLEMKIKGSWFATGGYEYNYQQPIYSLSQINRLSYWTPSGLAGISKQYKIGSKMKGNLQLLWDFLSYQQVPRTQPVVFRLGYTF